MNVYAIMLDPWYYGVLSNSIDILYDLLVPLPQVLFPFFVRGACRQVAKVVSSTMHQDDRGMCVTDTNRCSSKFFALVAKSKK